MINPKVLQIVLYNYILFSSLISVEREKGQIHYCIKGKSLSFIKKSPFRKTIKKLVNFLILIIVLSRFIDEAYID